MAGRSPPSLTALNKRTPLHRPSCYAPVTHTYGADPMKRLLHISRYHWLVVFLLAGLATVIIAYGSVNLLSMSMANLRFLREHGWLALTSGGAVQFALIGVNGILVLACFLLFKICETELVMRYRRWQDR